MSRSTQPHLRPERRLSHAAIVCFSVSAIAFVACGMGAFVNHMLTGSLAIGGTAAVGLIYLAMGLMNLGVGFETRTIEFAAESSAADPPGALGTRLVDGDAITRLPGKSVDAPEANGRISSTHDVALTLRD